MSRVAPVQASFNGGEIGQRLRARIDQSLYGISLAEMTGYAPLVEGPAEAMPGLLHVERAPGPFRPFRFEYNATQGHVLEASDGLFRVYTNDALLRDDADEPIEIESPYDWAAVQQLKTHQSFDVLYCFNGSLQPRQFVRYGAAEFDFELFETRNGPFEDRNLDENLRVAASGVTGTITLTASHPTASTAEIFAPGDVGGLFRMEVEDFGDTPAWEPGITVTAGTYRTSLERVYRAVTGGRTGTWQPAHTEGVEWDGMGSGADINDKPAGGVQWEYVHDKYGIARITAYTNATTVWAEVLRTLPFSSTRGTTGTGNYNYPGRYVDEEWDPYDRPGVVYSYGTWRWRFGAFSDRRGWPEGGIIWNERLCLWKGSTGYASTAADLDDFAELNELGEQSNDMAFTFTIPDPNPIVEAAGDDRLMLFTAAGAYALGPNSAAQGVGPKNFRLDRQHHWGSAKIDGVGMDGRTLTVSRCGTRIYKSEFDAGRQIAAPQDLTRYARHIGRPGFTSLAQQRHPFNQVWASRGDGSLACATYLPDEDVLGLAPRKLAAGLEAKYVTSITDPDGKFEQVWVAATFGGHWHMLRMAPWREDGESDDTGCVLDMAGQYGGALADEPTDTFSAPELAGMTIDVVADGRYTTATVAGDGSFSIDWAASRAVWGLPFEAAGELLPIEAGGDNGPARHKLARIGRAWIETIDARGLWFGAPGHLQPIEQLRIDEAVDTVWPPYTGASVIERAGDYTSAPTLRWERRAPFQGTVAAVGCEVEVKNKVGVS